MNISVIGPTYPYKGGISHFTTILVQHLRTVHNVDLISWSRQYPAFLYPVELKDTQSKNPIKTDAVFLLDFYNPITWYKTFRRIKKKKTDKLILTWASPIQAPIYFIISFFVKRFSKTKIMYICHNVLPHERAFYDEPLIKLAFSQADEFIVHSSEDKKELAGLVKGKKVTHGFLPIYDIFQNKKYDIQMIKTELKLKKRVLLFFGYIRPYKGLKYLLEAMPKIIKDYKHTSLVVVGEFWSKDKPEYMELVKNLGVENDVTFIDSYVPNEELGKYFAVSDVVVLPYVTATQSAAVQTAYGFNKPVIATSVGGLKDVIEEKVSGYFIKSQNADDIVEKVKYYYKNPIPSSTMIKVREKFSWDKYIDFIF